MVRIYLKKKNKPDVPEAVIQESVRAVQVRSCSSQTRNDLYSTALRN